MGAADYFVYALLVMYGGAGLMYAWEGNWPKFLYFLGSVVLTFGVQRM